MACLGSDAEATLRHQERSGEEGEAQRHQADVPKVDPDGREHEEHDGNQEQDRSN